VIKQCKKKTKVFIPTHKYSGGLYRPGVQEMQVECHSNVALRWWCLFKRLLIP